MLNRARPCQQGKVCIVMCPGCEETHIEGNLKQLVRDHDFTVEEMAAHLEAAARRLESYEEPNLVKPSLPSIGVDGPLDNIVE